MNIHYDIRTLDENDYIPGFDDLRPTAEQPGGQNNAIAANSPAHVRAQNLLEGLTPEQAEAVTHRGTPLVILAGAGSGKTNALTKRIAHLIATGDAMPGEILAVTFTNKAARELEKRIKSLLDDDLAGLKVGTFHAICADMLRKNAHYFNVPEDYVILDADDQKRLVKRLAKARWGKHVDADRIDEVMAFMENYRSDPSKAVEIINKTSDEIVGLYYDYEAAKKQDNVLDFTDLISVVYNAFATGTVDVREIAGHWKHILVDEYQDTNGLQFEWLKLIVGSNPNIAVVGDDDQVLYSWRGARIENILTFHEHFPQTKVIRLERNFRSKGYILDAANGLIAKNKQRLGKTLYTAEDKGQPVFIRYFLNADLEAKWIVDEIKSVLAKGEKPENIAILTRASHALNLIENKMTFAGIPYVLSGGRRFQDKAEVRDAMAYMRLASNPDDSASFERIVNTPKRGIGDIGIKKMLEGAEAARKAGTHLNLLQVADTFSRTKAFPGDVPAKLQQFVETMTKASAMFWRNATASELLTYLLDETGYRDEIRRVMEEAKSINDMTTFETAATRLSNLADLEQLGREMNPLELIEHLGLSEDGRSRNAKGVWIGTIHAAKGLEWQRVISVGWEENMFPTWQALAEKGDKLAEERRCAYVVITRARESLTITTTGERFLKPAIRSRFLADLPESACQFHDMQPDEDEPPSHPAKP